MPKNDFKHTSQADCARIFGCNIRTIRRWLVEGAPQNADATVSTAQIIEWRLQQEMAKNKPEESLNSRKTKAEIERIEAQTAKYKNETVERSYMEQVLVSRAASLRQFLERSIMMNLSKFVGLSLDEARTRLNWFAIKAMEAWTGGDSADDAQSAAPVPVAAEGAGGVSDKTDAGSS